MGETSKHPQQGLMQRLPPTAPNQPLPASQDYRPVQAHTICTDWPNWTLISSVWLPALQSTVLLYREQAKLNFYLISSTYISSHVQTLFHYSLTINWASPLNFLKLKSLESGNTRTRSRFLLNKNVLITMCNVSLPSIITMECLYTQQYIPKTCIHCNDELRIVMTNGQDIQLGLFLISSLTGASTLFSYSQLEDLFRHANGKDHKGLRWWILDSTEGWFEFQNLVLNLTSREVGSSVRSVVYTGWDRYRNIHWSTGTLPFHC